MSITSNFKLYYGPLLLIVVLYNGCSEQPFRSAVKTENGSDLSSQLPPNSPEATDEENNQSDQPPISPPADSDGGPAFFVLGKLGSTMYSCDKGRTWVGYQTPLPETRCADIDCSHGEFTPRGVTYGHKGFAATFGWGSPGQVISTVDGVNFDVVLPESSWADIAYGNETYMTHSFRPKRSQDLINWELREEKIQLRAKNMRQLEFVDYDGGYFIVMGGSDGVIDFAITRDNGETYEYPETRPENCGNGKLAYLKNNLIVRSRWGTCLSKDAGRNWQTIENAPGGYLLSDGQEFRIYQEEGFYHSQTGENWMYTPIEHVNFSRFWAGLRHVTYHPILKSYVAFSQKSYEQMEFYYSDDGTKWYRVDKANAEVPPAPHPVSDVAVGFLTSCPK